MGGGDGGADAGTLVGTADERRAIYDREKARALESMAARRGGGTRSAARRACVRARRE